AIGIVGKRSGMAQGIRRGDTVAGAIIEECAAAAAATTGATRSRYRRDRRAPTEGGAAVGRCNILRANDLRLALGSVLDGDAIDAIGAYRGEATAARIESMSLEDLPVAICDTEKQVRRVVAHVHGRTVGIHD